MTVNGPDIEVEIPQPSTYGDVVRFTAKVKANAPLKGTVQFRIDKDDFGSPATLTLSDPGSAIVTSDPISSLEVRDYAITATYVGDDGLVAGPSAERTLTVKTAHLTVTTKPATKAYGADLPDFAVSYQGFANGDSASSLGGTLEFETEATASSDAGSYDVTPKGLTSNNYAITFKAGKLEVTPAPLTITAKDASRTYGDAKVDFAVTYDDFVLGQDEKVLGGRLRFRILKSDGWFARAWFRLYTQMVPIPVDHYDIEPSGLTWSCLLAIVGGRSFPQGRILIRIAPAQLVCQNTSHVIV